MTLVVARCVGDRVHLVADAMSTHLHGTTAPRRDAHQLKVVILNRRLCVGFAGIISRAQVALERWPTDSTRRATIDHFLRVHRESDGDPDFLIASWGERLSLTRIRGGDPQENLTVAHIGNPEAHSAFQQQMTAVEEPATSPDGEGACLRNAMHAVIVSGRFADVGGFDVHARSGAGGFQYMEGATGHGMTFTASGAMQFLGAADGGFAYQTMVPDEPGVGALGVFFWQGNFGDLHHPRELRTPKRYLGVDSAGFIAAVRRDHNITLTSPVIG